jgi:two-component system cell cycle sensor histidine kinase/response regulator CckA
MAESATLRSDLDQSPALTPAQLNAAIDVLQERIRELEQALERHERLATVGTIAGLIAHEFNNILTPVLSYAQMALSSPDDRELTVKALQRAADSAERAGQIASAILGLVRREHSPRAVTMRCVLGEALDRATACLARPLQKDGIELVVEIDRDTAIAARPVAVEHVLLNLIINARNAMAGRGGTLRVCSARNVPKISAEAVRSWSGGDQWPRAVMASPVVAVLIEDSGCGIAPERLRTLLNLDTTIAQTKQTTNMVGGTDRRGHGLGMLVCKRLVEDAGGALAVESQLGRGTSVWVLWPANDAEGGPPAQQQDCG